MREIKFRGKRVDDGELVEGYYIKTGKYFHGGETHCIVIEGSVCNYAGLEFVSVIPESVSRFTGLKDLNGKEIFENDTVKIFNNITYIEYYLGSVCYMTKLGHINIHGSRVTVNSNYECIEIEIIGNKFDNPELLKEV